MPDDEKTNDLLNLETERKWRADRNKEKQDRRLNDIRAVLGSIEGRRWMWDIMAEAGVFKTTMTGDNYTFFNEGRRTVGIAILDEILEANPSAFLQMQRERKADAKREELEEKEIKDKKKEI